MDTKLAKYLSDKYKIDISQVVREFWEMVLLYEFFSFEKSKYLVFKGGTALRLAYKSPRFSEDLDFSLTSKLFTAKDAKSIVNDSISNYPNVNVDDYALKYNTYFFELKVADECLRYPFRIKVEISKREVNRKYESVITEISSETFPYKSLANVASLEQVYKDKLQCVSTRRKPRDYFDLWFISQTLNTPYVKQDVISKVDMTRELRKYLPKNFYRAIDLL